MIYLSAADLLTIGERVVEGDVVVRDRGLLESAAHRPQTAAFGADAYPSLEEKAAALLHSLVNNHPLVDGNKRLGLGGLIAFLGLNDRQLTLDNDEAYDLVIDVATGALSEVPDIAARIAAGSRPR